MNATYGFHPEALVEYAEATKYYRDEVSVDLAEQFVYLVENAPAELLTSPARWRIKEEPGIRRYVMHRFPYVIYYRWESENNQVAIYAVMHCSREPGYWRHRVR